MSRRRLLRSGLRRKMKGEPPDGAATDDLYGSLSTRAVPSESPSWYGRTRIAPFASRFITATRRRFLFSLHHPQ
jgi:hypothetical protein